MKVHTNDRLRVMLTVPVMSVEYIPTTKILRQLQRDVSQCPWVQIDENIWTTKRLRENVAFIANGFEVLGSLFVGIPLPKWQEWAQLPAWSSEKTWPNEGPGLEHLVISRVPMDERPRAGDPLTNLDDEMKQCLLGLLSQTPNLDFEGASQNTIQQEAFRKKGKHTSAEEVDAATMFTLVELTGKAVQRI